MKWLFYTLLVVNVAYLAWELKRLEPPAVPTTAEAQLPGHVNRLLLLEEAGESELRKRSHVRLEPEVESPPDITALVEDVVMEPSPATVCYSLGPLATDEEIEQMRAWLGDHGAVPVLRPAERRELSLYWVHFPPFSSREEAVERVVEMKNEGIDDIYVIPGGDMAHAVSLGVFTRRESLERRLAELRRNGYHPWVVPRYRTEKASWFDVEFPEGLDFPETTFFERFPSAEALRSDCT